MLPEPGISCEQALNRANAGNFGPQRGGECENRRRGRTSATESLFTSAELAMTEGGSSNSADICKKQAALLTPTKIYWESLN